MDFLPLYFNLRSSTALVSGTGVAAQRKIELLVRAGCKVKWCGADSDLLVSLPCQTKDISIAGEPKSTLEAGGIDLVVAASDSLSDDRQLAERAKARKIPVNVVNQSELSTFIFPSIIDRSPVIAAISSSGELPVLTRILRSRLESTIPHGFGRLAELAKRYREKVRATFPTLQTRRRFWERHLEGPFAELVLSGDEAEAVAVIESALENAEDLERQNNGEVYLVGAGPGDPDLLSFKALRLMRQADVVLYDRLVAPAILRLVRQDAEMINVGKERDKHTLPQESINALLVKLALEGKRVLRLKGGDPFIFGRGGEEIDLLAENRIAFQVVPGVTAAAGCAAYSGIPLTHRDFSQSVRFITGHLKNNTCDLPWQEFVHAHQTLVFYMGLASLSHISQSLIAHGMSPDKPAALVSRGTTPDQQVVTGDIASLPELAISRGVKAPTIIIVGEVVTLRDKLNWRD